MFHYTTSALLILFCTFFSSAQSSIEDIKTFPIPPNEIGCMRNFNTNENTLHPFNNFILSKMNEIMYPERLDYQLRYMQNFQQPLDTLISTDWLKQHQIINNRNFEEGYKARFEHYFPKEDSVKFHFIYRLEYLNHPLVPWKDYFGYDPEIMVVSTKRYVIVLFRGTDDIEGNRFGEWVGTDFRFLKTKLPNREKVHKGLYNSYSIAKTDLLNYFSNNIKEDTPIFLTGHSLGGAQAIFASLDLAEIGFNVTQVVTFASPNAIGNKAFVKRFKQHNIKLDRFEYGNDMVAILDWPGYHEFGNRHWIDENNTIYFNLPFRSKKIAKEIPEEIPKVALEKSLFEINIKSYHHNPQFIVKALYEQLPGSNHSEIPCIDDSYPFLYYTLEPSK